MVCLQDLTASDRMGEGYVLVADCYTELFSQDDDLCPDSCTQWAQLVRPNLAMLRQLATGSLPCCLRPCCVSHIGWFATT